MKVFPPGYIKGGGRRGACSVPIPQHFFDPALLGHGPGLQTSNHVISRRHTALSTVRRTVPHAEAICVFAGDIDPSRTRGDARVAVAFEAHGTSRAAVQDLIHGDRRRAAESGDMPTIGETLVA